jgi:RNA polymerase sigma-70 factor (ECF subfamily)
LERLRQPRLPTLSLSGLTGRGDWVLFAPEKDPVSDLDDALASLSDDHRLVLTLCDLQGLTAAEAAIVLGRTTAATKSLHGRARRALRDALERDALEKEDA